MHLVLIAAQSLDGFITKHAEPGTAFTSPEDKAYFRKIVAGFDVCLFGGETYRVSRDFIRDRLPGAALRVVMTRSPERYAADGIAGGDERRFEFSGRFHGGNFLRWRLVQTRASSFFTQS
jgi:dihydrofolate reductase